MIRDTHVQQLRDLVDQAERDLAGWRFLLGQAEQVERGGTVMPDPLMPAGAPWPAPPAPPLLPRGVEPYPPTSVLPPIDGSTLPPHQEAALDTLSSEHDAYAHSRDGVKENQKWQAS